MDIQYVGDASFLLVRYVTNYVGKHDKGSTQPMWSTMGRIKNEKVQPKMWSYASGAMRNREIGLPEACDNLLLHVPCKFSQGDDPVYLNCTPFRKRCRAIPSRKSLN